MLPTGFYLNVLRRDRQIRMQIHQLMDLMIFWGTVPILPAGAGAR
jgi:hypothetical protein